MASAFFTCDTNEPFDRAAFTVLGEVVHTKWNGDVNLITTFQSWRIFTMDA